MTEEEMRMVDCVLLAAGVQSNHIVWLNGRLHSAETLPNARGEAWALRYDDGQAVSLRGYYLENNGRKSRIASSHDETTKLLLALRAFTDVMKGTQVSDVATDSLLVAICCRRLLADAAEKQHLDVDEAVRLLEMAVKVFDKSYQMP